MSKRAERTIPHVDIQQGENVVTYATGEPELLFPGFYQVPWWVFDHLNGGIDPVSSGKTRAWGKARVMLKAKSSAEDAVWIWRM